MSYILSISQLKANIKGVEHQNPLNNYSGFSAGEKHIYENIYLPLLRGQNILIREIDFDSFDSEDIESFYHFFSQKLSDDLSRIGKLYDCITSGASISTPVTFI